MTRCISNVQIDREAAIIHALPCDEVKRIARFKGLKYYCTGTAFYEFVVLLESIFIEAKINLTWPAGSKH